MRETIAKTLWEIELEKCFVSIVGRNDVSAPKPNPEGILKTITDAQWKKENFIMIWDSESSDIAAADRSEIDSFLIDMHL